MVKCQSTIILEEINPLYAITDIITLRYQVN